MPDGPPIRIADRDRYLAALLADEPARGQLLALYAFDLELAAIPDKVSEPLIGEMRLQWWRDAIGMLMHGGTTGSPLADALAPAIAGGRLPLSAFEQIVDARRFDLYGELMQRQDELMAYCGAVFGIPIQLACLILGRGADRNSGTAAGHAGVVAGLIWLLENFGRHAAKGRVYVPGDMLSRYGIEAQHLLQGQNMPELAPLVMELAVLTEQRLDALNEELTTLERPLRPAFAHLACAHRRLAALRRNRRPLAPVAGPSPLRRQWAIWRFARTGRIV